MVKKFNLQSYKDSIGVDEVPLKKSKYVVLDECLQSVLGQPGFELGHITQIYGKSDTGKTSLLFHAAAKAQQQGILPILIITEGKVDWDRAASMGFNKDNAIVHSGLEYMEDVFEFMEARIQDMHSGVLPENIMFFWDSIGNTISRQEVKEDPKTGKLTRAKTMMVASKVLSANLRIFSKKINDTRKEPCPKQVGAVFINSGYNKPPTFPGGMTSFVPYGGEKPYYVCTLIIKTARTKKLEAIKEGRKLKFGIVSKITTEKNHSGAVSMAGEFVITADEIIPNDATAIKHYKDTHKDSWGDIEIGEQNES